MTDKNREIEEFENDLIKTFDEEYNKRRLITPDFTAEALYNAGYRKAYEVAREIFEEIENLMQSLDRRHISCGNPKQAWGIRNALTEIVKLKKKYTEGE